MLFATGPDASLNSLALKLSGIDRDFKVTDGGSKGEILHEFDPNAQSIIFAPPLRGGL